MKKTIYLIAILSILWLLVTTVFYAFANPTKTQTEVFLHIPKSLVLDFSE